MRPGVGWPPTAQRGGHQTRGRTGPGTGPAASARRVPVAPEEGLVNAPVGTHRRHHRACNLKQLHDGSLPSLAGGAALRRAGRVTRGLGGRLPPGARRVHTFRELALRDASVSTEKRQAATRQTSLDSLAVYQSSDERVTERARARVAGEAVTTRPEHRVRRAARRGAASPAGVTPPSAAPGTKTGPRTGHPGLPLCLTPSKGAAARAPVPPRPGAAHTRHASLWPPGRDGTRGVAADAPLPPQVHGSETRRLKSETVTAPQSLNVREIRTRSKPFLALCDSALSETVPVLSSIL